MKAVYGVFDTRSEAERAVSGLMNAGYPRDEISIITRRGGKIIEAHADEVGEPKRETNVTEGATIGAATGGVLGALLAGASVIAGAGVVATGGASLVVTGPIMAALAGLGAGSAAGGLVGGLIGYGIEKDDAEMVAKRIAEGDVVVTVKTDEDSADAARRILYSKGMPTIS